MRLLNVANLMILLCFNICTSWTQAPPNAIDHANDILAQLVSLDSVNITWRIPADNNAPITSYALTFCARLSRSGMNCGTSVNITVQAGDLTRVSNNQLQYTFPELLMEKLYEVVIRAENSVGLQMSPALGNGFEFNSTFPDNGRVVNVGFIPTTRLVIVTWNLPALARATANLNVSFDVTYYNVAEPTNIISVTVEYNPLQLEQGFSADLMTEDSPSHVFQIAARYINPNLLSSQATLSGVRTLANGATLITGPQAVVTNTVSLGDVLTISWPAPSNINFLVAYSVSYSTSSRSRRQASSSVEVLADTTSTTLPFTAFSDYTVDVDAVYAPPPDGNRVTINLLPSTTFTTPQRSSSPPLNIVAVSEAVLKIRLTWDPPSNPRGIVTRYRVTIDGVSETIIDGMTTYLSQELSPYTVYTYTILAINGFGDGEVSPAMIFRTNFSVVQPVITSTSVGGANGTPRFTINTDRFNQHYGDVGGYKVVVVRGSQVNPADIPDSQLAPAEESQFNYYVAYYGDVRRQLRSTFIIGDNSRTTDSNGTIFTNPPPVTGEDYYVFIRLYSSIDSSVFANSQLTGVLRFGPPGNLGATTTTTVNDVTTSLGAIPWPTISLLIIMYMFSLAIFAII